ncbi:MAG: 1-deoxy-D-xylulose-5-phosphate reductoisomerase [Eggerthellaceae bacterium]|nr:1-deoxy-D-xylulose-5-phosphate reductoisomerase [Eggerthellaceae bacterium]
MSIQNPAARKRVLVLGSTGSIGRQTLDVASKNPDEIEIVGLSAYSNVELVLEQAQKFGVSKVAIARKDLEGSSETAQLFDWISGQKDGYLGFGPEAVVDLIEISDPDMVVNALVGAAGLEASYRTLRLGRTLALANKESLVVGGDIIMPLSAKLDESRGYKGALLPIDSEHGAIYQCLIGEDPAEVEKLWITASGGPFRGKKRQDLYSITPEEALAHPTWHMGPKISIDSSTLMNKGLEVIEAHHLFDMDYYRIRVVVQPQSAIHSMVEFRDASVKAHMGTTDMRIPIQFCLSYPKRWESAVEPLDFTKMGRLDFEEPDTETFRCLALARRAGMTGGTLPAAMNAANEVAVASFLAGKSGYMDIEACVEASMEAHVVQPVQSIEQLLEVDRETRRFASEWLENAR